MSSHGFLLATYAPGSSLIHRAPLWLKFLLVVGCGMASFLIADWAVSAVVLALLSGLFLLSGAGPARLFRAVRPVLPVLLAIGLFQWWQLGAPTAARIVLNVLVCVVAASILTATTPVQALLDGVASLARPFRRLGADPERFALTIAIMLRSIPFVAGAYSDVRDSARARGLERNPAGIWCCPSSSPRWPTPGRPARLLPPADLASRRTRRGSSECLPTSNPSA